MLIQANHLEERGDQVGAEVLRGLDVAGVPSLHALALQATLVPSHYRPDIFVDGDGGWIWHGIGDGTGNGNSLGNGSGNADGGDGSTSPPTSAAMAWLGGGAISAGGFGMMGGAVVMTGGIALAGAAVAGTVYWAYGYFDEKADLERIRLTLDRLIAKESFGPPSRGHFERVGIGQRPPQ